MLFPVYFIPPWPWPLTSWSQIVKRSSLTHNASLCKLGDNVSNTLQDIVLTFRDAHTDVRTHARTRRQTGQKQYASSSHTTLGGGIKISPAEYKPGVLWQFCQLAFRWWGTRWRHSRETQPASPHLHTSLLPSGRLCNTRRHLLPILYSVVKQTWRRLNTTMLKG